MKTDTETVLKLLEIIENQDKIISDQKELIKNLTIKNLELNNLIDTQ